MASTAHSTVRPTVRIISPVGGAKISSTSTVTFRVAISHFTLAPGGIEPAGSGQVWVYANGQIKSRQGSTTATLILAPGTYTLKAVLVTNGKPVASSAPIVVSVSSAPPPPDPVSCAHTPQPSSGLKTGTITLFCHGLPAGITVGRHLVAGPGGDLWFTVSAASGNGINGIGRITPSGAITVFNSQTLAAGGGVGNLVTGPDGNLWFTANGEVGRITPSGTITVFSHGLPTGGFLGNLVTGPGGDLWFYVNPTSANGTGAIGRITPSGIITVFSHGLPAGSGAGNLVTGPGGDLWFSVYSKGAIGIGRITPSGAITVFNSPALAAGSVVGHLVTGPGGDLWFPVYPTATGNGGNGAIGIGRITPSGTLTVFSHGLPAGSLWGGNSKAAEYGAGQLLVGPGGNLWFTVAPAFSSSAPSSPGAIGRITPSGVITVFSHGLPAGGVVGNLVKGPDGNLWFPVNGQIGRITPPGAIAVFSHGLPAGGFVGNLVSGPDGNVWFPTSANGANAIGRITPSGVITVFNSQALAAGGGAGNLVTGPDGNLWFLVPPAGSFCCITTTNAIGRIVP